jgi:TPR repeat protein
MSKTGIELFKEGKDDEALRILTLYIKNTKNKYHNNYFKTHEMINIILKRHNISEARLKWLTIKRDFPQIMCIIAKVHYCGSGVEVDYEVAIRCLRLSNTHHSLYLLGNMYHNGVGIKKNDKLAMECYKKSSNQGNMLAQYTLGEMYKSVNMAEAVRYLKMSCDQKCDKALFSLGKIYLTLEGKKMLGNKYLYMSRTRGNKDATEEVRYYKGKNIYAGINYYIKRVKIVSYERSDSAWSCVLKYNCDDLEVCKKLSDGFKNAMKSKRVHRYFQKDAIGFHKQLLEKYPSDSDFIFNYGMIHTMITTPSIGYLQNSVDQGNMQGIYEMGRILYNGELIEKDTVKGIDYITKAAKEGCLDAQTFLFNIPTSEYFLQMVNINEPRALYEMGQQYKNGNKVVSDYNLAREYMIRSAEGGNRDAIKYLAGVDLFPLDKSIQSKIINLIERGSKDVVPESGFYRYSAKYTCGRKLHELYSKGKIVQKDIYKALYYACVIKDDFMIEKFLKDNPAVFREIVYFTYEKEKLKEIEHWKLSSSLSVIKKYIETGNDIRIKLVGLWHITSQYLKKRTEITSSVLNETSLYIRDLHRIIIKY